MEVGPYPVEKETIVRRGASRRLGPARSFRRSVVEKLRMGVDKVGGTACGSRLLALGLFALGVRAGLGLPRDTIDGAARAKMAYLLVNFGNIIGHLMLLIPDAQGSLAACPEPHRNQLRHAGLLHGYAVEYGRDAHRFLAVRDQDELRF